MEKPDLNKMWETWISIGPKSSLTHKKIQDAIRNKIHPMVSSLMTEGTINWYHFLFHPYLRDPNNAYFHIRFSVVGDIEKADDLNLPRYCVAPERLNPIRTIAGINEALLKDEEIEEAWRIIGEQSEWIINLINIHKENIGWIPIDQFVQFLHYFTNMLGLGHLSKISMTF